MSGSQILKVGRSNNSFWRNLADKFGNHPFWRNFKNNFSLYFELDARIDRLRTELESLPDQVAPGLSAAMRTKLIQQLDDASSQLKEREPLERVIQRINFVESEILIRVTDDRLDLVIESLRAEATGKLPEPARKSVLDELDKIAALNDAPQKKKTKLVGLKARIESMIIEFYRGSERSRSAIETLGVILIFLLITVVVLFEHNKDLSKALFTHYGTPVIMEEQEFQLLDIVAPTDASGAIRIEPNGTSAAQPPASTPNKSGGPAGTVREVRHIVPDGKAPLINIAFPVVLVAVAFGGIGACLSGLFSFTLQQRVPGEYEGYFRTLIRPVIGMASGFLAVFLLRAGVFAFGDDLAWVAIIAFVFGFSERLFVGTIEKMNTLPK
jgi:hypothetical protein